MDRPLSEHIVHLQRRIKNLNSQLMEVSRTIEERNRIESEIRAAWETLLATLVIPACRRGCRVSPFSQQKISGMITQLFRFLPDTPPHQRRPILRFIQRSPAIQRQYDSKQVRLLREPFPCGSARCMANALSVVPVQQSSGICCRS